MILARSIIAFGVALVSVSACAGTPQAQQKAAGGHEPSEREEMPKPYEGPLTGTERVAWLQQVGAGTRIAEFSFFIYVDGNKRPLPHVECRLMRGSRHQLCEAPLPEMPPGKHTLRFSAVRVVDGKEMASALSDAIVVMRGLERGAS